MKRLALVLAVVALVPVAAWADTINLTNHFGTVTITNAGIISQGSQLSSFDGITAGAGHALGTVSFSTGALSSGNIFTGGTFSSVGSSFVVTGIGNGGQPKGVIFSGAFVGPISWTIVGTQGNFGVTYQLSGTVQGMLFNGHLVTGKVTETIQTFKNQVIVDNRGNVMFGSLTAVPEPGTLGLFGTGLVAIAGLFRRKLFGS
ncbi:MAG TPA: PEP-CTERM sorting domain-containing protein [Terriglobales bacterium]|nr:PEP-CTERM sorting domain-containing protein [Terriglobales bacterium]